MRKSTQLILAVLSLMFHWSSVLFMALLGNWLLFGLSCGFMVIAWHWMTREVLPLLDKETGDKL